MLHVFRESLGRYVAIAILALIGVTFIFFGIDFSITRSSYAAKVNGEPIPIQTFEDELLRRQTQYQQETRTELTDDDRLYLRRDVLDRLVMREALLQKARDTGYRVSDQRVVEDIRSIPAFQVGGQFSADVYRSLLAAQGYSTAAFEAQQREDSTLQELQNTIMDSAFITPAEFRRSIELVYERRQIAWAEFAAEDFIDQVEITDDEVANYHADNAALFMTEEAVDLEYIELDLASVAASTEVSEDELREYYDEESANFAGGEERQVRHIQIAIGDDPDAARAEAEALLARLQAGEDFAALAGEFSDDAGTSGSGGELGWMARGVLPEPLEEALFALNIGELAGPVETAFGYHLVRLDDIRVTEQPPFELERERIRMALAEDRSYSEFIDAVDELDDAAYDAINDLASVADRLGLQLRRVERLTRSNAAAYFPNAAAIVFDAFNDEAIVTGNNSELIQFGDDVVGVIRVAGHYPPEPQPLDAVADDIRELLRFDAAAELAAAAAESFSEALDADAVAAGTQDPVELAATYGGVWHEPVWISRAAASEVPAAIGSRVLSEIRPAAGEVPKLRVPTGSYDESVVLLLAVEPGVPADIPTEEREQGQQELVVQIAQGEFAAYADDTRRRTKVRVPDGVLNPDL